MTANHIRARCGARALAVGRRGLVRRGQTPRRQQPRRRRSIARAIPTAGKTPELHVPAWTKVTLTNGARARRVGEARPAARLVQINFVGGAAQYDPADKTGLGEFVRADADRGHDAPHRRPDLEAICSCSARASARASARESGRMAFLVDEGQVRADARDPRRRARESDLPAGRARSTEGAHDRRRCTQESRSHDGRSRASCSRRCCTRRAIRTAAR